MGSVELDVRQIHCLVLSEPGERKRKQEEVSFKLWHKRGQGVRNTLCMRQKRQHCEWDQSMKMTSKDIFPTPVPRSHPALQVWLLPEVPKTLADTHAQGRVPALMADQEPFWPSPYLHFKQKILAIYSERY